jgi:hypothetical protein
MRETHIDAKIRQTLSAKDAKLYDQYAKSPSLLQLWVESFNGTNAWTSILVMIVGIVFMGIAVYSIIQFMSTPADSTKALISWALVFLFSTAAISMLKLWAWLDIQRLMVVREIKRFELQFTQMMRRDNDE